jgi:aminocarboxymuconate-semialdehyde decarboxylase
MENAPLAIDFHAHFLVRDVLEQCLPHSVATNHGRDQLQPHHVSLFENMMKPQGVIDDMDRRGIAMSVVSVATVLSPLYWAEPSIALSLSRELNDTAARWVADFPDRIVGSFVLPLQDMKLAIAEMDRAVGELGLKVANIPTEVRSIYLGDVRFSPFWKAAQDLGVTVFVHPDGAKDPWFFQWGMWNSLGQSLEEAKFMASVIYEGILEFHPKLRLVIAHGGGYFPHNMGRLDRNVRNAPDSMRNITRKPSEFLKNVYYDTCLYDPAVLTALVKVVGADRLLLGSDWPIGEPDPIGLVNRCPDIGDLEKSMILGRRAAELIDLHR